jgi:ABC-type nitrate/sulfonate/bicarbonate transport system permease component
MAGTATVEMVASLQWEKRHQLWQRNWFLLVVAVVVTLASSLVGVVLAGVVGVLVGLALGAISTAAGAFALVRVREITRGEA